MRLAWLLSWTAFAVIGDDRLVLTARGLSSPVAAYDNDGNIVVAGIAGLLGQAFVPPCLAGETCSGEPRTLASPQIYVAGFTRAGDRRLFEFSFAAAEPWILGSVTPMPDGGLIVASGAAAGYSVRRYDERQNLRWTAEIPVERASLGFALRPNGDLIYSGSGFQGNLSPVALILGRITPEGRVEPSPLKIGGRQISFGPDGSVLLAGQAIAGVEQAFPATPGAFQPEAPFTFCGSGGFLMRPCAHQIVAHVSADLRTLKMATFLTGRTGASATAPPMLLPDGSIAVAGYTSSEDYPGTEGAWISKFPSRVPLGFRGSINAVAGFVSVLSGDGRQLLRSTFVGGLGSANLLNAEPMSDGRLRLAGTTSTGFEGLRGRTATCAPFDGRLGANGLSASASFEMEFDVAAMRPGRSIVRPLSSAAGPLNQDQRLVWSVFNGVSSLMLADVALREPAPAIHCVEEPAVAEPQADQIAPGQLVALFGAGWPIGERAGYDTSATALPRALAGVRLLADGDPLPLIYVSPEQINFAAPSRWEPGQRKRLDLEVNGERLASKEFTVVPRRAALFQNIDNRCSFPVALAVNPESGEIYDCPSPAPRDGVVSVFVQGIGINAERQEDGQINREADIAPPVSIEAADGQVVSVTPAIGQAAGMWQVKVRLNAAAGSGVTRFPLRIGGEVRDVAVSTR